MYFTDEELLEFGVERIDERCFKIPCEICGRKIRRTQFSPKRNYICDYCKGLIKEKRKVKIPNAETKCERRFKNAVEEIKNQVKNFDDYERAIKLAKTRCKLYGSIPEAMVCIELLRLNHKVIPQQKIGKYKVDFVVKDLKTVIEVDGEIYHRKINSDREAMIQVSLGMEWKIKHVPAELIRKDIQKLNKVLEL